MSDTKTAAGKTGGRRCYASTDDAWTCPASNSTAVTRWPRTGARPLVTKGVKQPERRICFFVPNTDQPLACASPQADNHHDLFDTETSFGERCSLLGEAQIALEGIFPNANNEFDAKTLRADCFRRGIKANIAPNPRSGQRQEAEDTHLDSKLYSPRTAMERSNAWLDRFKTLLVRFATSVDSWLAFHFLAFVVLLLRKIPTDPKS